MSTHAVPSLLSVLSAWSVPGLATVSSTPRALAWQVPGLLATPGPLPVSAPLTAFLPGPAPTISALSSVNALHLSIIIAQLMFKNIVHIH